MCKDIENFVRSYLVCQVMKSNKGRKLVYSSPFCFPHSKWEQIATALVLDLPPLARYTTVVVFVDCFNEMVHFAPRTKEIHVDYYAQLLVDNVFRLHVMPKAIISDLDPRFTC